MRTAAPRSGRASLTERRNYNRTRPPKPSNDVIADYACANIECPACGAVPRSACTGPREHWMTVCKDRFIAAALIVTDAWKEQHPSWERLEGIARVDLAEQRHIFATEVPWSDITDRVRQMVAEQEAGRR
jgi:hypothetical protein